MMIYEHKFYLFYYKNENYKIIENESEQEGII